MNVLAQLMELASIDILYHTTGAHNALQILKNGEFKLPFSETNASETTMQDVVDGKRKIVKRSLPGLFYLSTARTLSSGYIADRSKNLGKVQEPVTFVIDTKKLRSKNRGIVIKPFEYWGMDATGRKYGSARESEERIYSNNHKLNIKGCLKVLIIVKDAEYGFVWNARQVYSYCLKNRIPCQLFTYDNFQGFLHQKQTQADREKAIQILRQAKRSSQYQTAHNGVLPYASKTALKHWNKQGKMNERVTDFDALKALVEKEDYNDLPQTVRSRFLGRSWDNETLGQRFGNYLHNLRAENTRGGSEIEKVGNFVKRMKAKSLSEMFSKLDKKWDRLYKRYEEEEDRKWREQNPNAKSWD